MKSVASKLMEPSYIYTHIVFVPGQRVQLT